MKLILSSCDFRNDDSNKTIIDNLNKPINKCKLLFIPNEKATMKLIHSEKYFLRMQEFGFAKDNIEIIKKKNKTERGFTMIYVCSDLHGYSLEKFKTFLDKIGFCNRDFLYVLGDVIDRGKDGIKTLKWLMSIPNAQLILGNHEQMMLASSFVFDEITNESIDNLTGSKLIAYSTWTANSSQPTIDALAATRPSEIKYILEYLQEAPMYETVTVNGKDFILTHSGLGNFSPDKKLSEYTSDELLWNRPNIEQRYFHDIIVVFGHTPTVYYGDEYKGKILLTDTWIDIDVGAGLGLPPAILRLDDMKTFYCEE